jgi:radical SAM protein with 4Fe4S-binding SPASM domain
MDFLRKAAIGVYKKLETDRHELSYLFFEITRRCNLACRHCGSDCTSVTSAAELTADSWVKIARYVADRFGTSPAVVITGGEPLVHPEILRIGQGIRDAGLRWGMVTNGWLLTQERLTELQEAGMISITVSLDGLSATHDSLRGRAGSRDRAMQALEYIAASGIPHHDAVTCVYPDNLGELDAVARDLVEAGVKAWRLFRVFPLGRARDDESLKLDRESTRAMLDWVASARKRYAPLGLRINYSCEGYMPLALDRSVRDFPFFCRAGINIASILADGSVTGCSNNRSRFYVGNVLRDDFTELWENGFSVFRDRSWAKDGRCGTCREFKKCGGSSIHLWNDGKRDIEFCYCGENGSPVA